MGPSPVWRGRFGTRWWPADQATLQAGQVERPPPTFSTDSGFSSSCRRTTTKAWVEPPQTLAGRPAPGPTRPRVWPTWSTCEIHPCGDDDFDIWSTSLCHPLKCSNLVPKFLKSNKHKNHGTRLVDKVTTWLFYTFTRHVGARN
jgi:hypothetical protein